MLFNNIMRGVARLCPVAIITFLLAGILTARTQGAPVHPIYDNEQQRPPNIVLILFDMVNDPGEIANLYYQADYREQLSLMLEQSMNLQDELAIKLVRKEIAIVDDPDYKYKLY